MPSDVINFLLATATDALYTLVETTARQADATATSGEEKQHQQGDEEDEPPGDHALAHNLTYKGKED